MIGLKWEWNRLESRNKFSNEENNKRWEEEERGTEGQGDKGTRGVGGKNMGTICRWATNESNRTNRRGEGGGGRGLGKLWVQLADGR